MLYFQAVNVMRSAGKSVRMVVDKCEPSYDAMSDSMTSVQSSLTFGNTPLLLCIPLYPIPVSLNVLRMKYLQCSNHFRRARQHESIV